MGRKLLAAKGALVLILTTASLPMPGAGIPVIDGTNLAQNIMSAIESTNQTLKLIEQYQTQLQQYQNQLRNTMAPAAYIWDQARSTMNNLRGAIDTLSYYRHQLGSIDSYLEKFGSLDYYRNSPCFNPNATCTAAEWAKLEEARSLGFESQKRAIDALFRGLDQQQDAIETDAARLEQLQQAAQGASGQMQAIGFANQLASQQANQLLQIRALLIAQQNAETTRMQAKMDEEARQAAADEQFRSGTYTASTPKSWSISDAK